MHNQNIKVLCGVHKTSDEFSAKLVNYAFKNISILRYIYPSLSLSLSLSHAHASTFGNNPWRRTRFHSHAVKFHMHGQLCTASVRNKFLSSPRHLPSNFPIYSLISQLNFQISSVFSFEQIQSATSSTLEHIALLRFIKSSPQVKEK